MNDNNLVYPETARLPTQNVNAIEKYFHKIHINNNITFLICLDAKPILIFSYRDLLLLVAQRTTRRNVGWLNNVVPEFYDKFLYRVLSKPNLINPN